MEMPPTALDLTNTHYRHKLWVK